MRRGSNSFGLIVFLIVAAIVVYLAAQNWTAVKQTSHLSESPTAVRQIPGMKNMKTNTDAHSSAVANALTATEAEGSAAADDPQH